MTIQAIDARTVINKINKLRISCILSGGYDGLICITFSFLILFSVPLCIVLFMYIQQTKSCFFCCCFKKNKINRSGLKNITASCYDLF